MNLTTRPFKTPRCRIQPSPWGHRWARLALTLLALCLGSSWARAQVSLVRLSSVQVEGSNVVVAARAPSGAQSAILESRPGIGSGLWQSRVTTVLSGASSNLVFRLPRSPGMEVFRVRLEGLSQRPLKMIVFGDSLSDTGNHFDLAGTPAPPNFSGRYSDGPIWAEHLATHLGLATNEWINYAVGSATSGWEDAYGRLDKPGLLDQLQLYLSDSPGLSDSPTNALYVLWIGANDFARWFYTGAHTNQNPEQLIGELLGNVRHAIETLAQSGARRFLVPNLPNLGEIPLVRGYNNPVASHAATLGALGYNANLAWMLSQLRVSWSNTLEFAYFDVFSIYEAARMRPADFGFTNVTSGCWIEEAGTVCPQPATHLFWDKLHPSAAAHRILGQGAYQAVVAPPPLPPLTPLYPTNAPAIQITSRHGGFTLTPTLEVRGMVRGPSPADAEVLVNGAPALPAADGTFTAMVVLAANQVAHPVVAELRAGSRVLARDRIVVHRGPSLRSGVMAPNAAVATLHSNALSAVSDTITASLFASGQVDLNRFIPYVLDADPFGTFQYAVVSMPAQYSCFTVEPQMSNGFIRVQFTLHDVLVKYNFKAWLDDLPDPGFSCNGAFYAGNFTASMDVSVSPAAGGTTGDVVVRPLGGIRWELVNFQQMVYGCDLDGLLAKFGFDLRAWFLQRMPDVQGYVRNAIADYLDVERSALLASELQEVIGRVRLAQPIGEAVGVAVAGDIENILHRSSQLDVRFSAALGTTHATGTETYAPPVGTIQHTGFHPVTGDAYGFAVSVPYKTLNQLLLADPERIALSKERSQIDLGTGSRPLTAGLLSMLFPALSGESPGTPYKLILRSTLPPMLTGGPDGDCAGAQLALNQLQIELVRQGAGGGNVALGVAVDLQGCVELGFDRASSALTVKVRFSAGSLRDIVVVQNQIGAHEAVVQRLVELALRSILPETTPEPWRLVLPALRGLETTPAGVQAEPGYVTVFFRLKPEHPRPDLVVTEVSCLPSIDPNFAFSVSARIKNVGLLPAWGGVRVGASVSLDTRPVNGDDVGVGQAFFPFNGGVLGVNESQWITLQNLRPAQPVALTQQTLFVGVDVPEQIGGSGHFCETSELNNQKGVPVRLGRPDLVVSDVEVLTPITPSRTFQCQVQIRNNGNGPAFLPIMIGMGLSLDCIAMNGNESDLGGYPITLQPPLMPGESRWFPITTRPVGNARFGSQNLIVGVDVNFVIPEENENNNLRCHPVRVEGPDLDIHSLRVLDTVRQWNSFRVECIVTNRGPISVTVPFSIGFGLSTDAIPMNGNDYDLGTYQLSSIAGHGYRKFTFTTRQLQNAFLGNQYVLAGSDIFFNVAETNEDNNMGKVAVTVR